MFYKPVFNFASRSKLLGRPVYVVAGKRTPIGSFGGKLSKIPSIELGGHAIKACLSSINLPGTEIDEAILGVAMQAGAGPGPARLAALKGGMINVFEWFLRIFVRCCSNYCLHCDQQVVLFIFEGNQPWSGDDCL